jgi:hypothetical protein
MALRWSTVKREHVAKACDLILSGQHQPRASAKGLFLLYGEQRLPVKHALRLAYCLANELPLDTPVKFASGEGSLNLLRRLAFTVSRQASQKGAQAEITDDK